MTKKYRIARLIAALIGLLAGGQVASAADTGGALVQCCTDLEDRVATLEATTARKDTKNVSVTISGEVSRGLYWYDGHYGGAIDNPNAPTKFSIGGTVKIAPDVTAGYVLELGVDTDAYVRQSFLWIGTAYGTATIGKTGGATYQIADQQVTNVNVLARPSIAYGRLIDGELSDVIRYDTPTVAGFTASASIAGTSAWDVAIRHRHHYSDFKVAAGLGYAEDDFGRRVSGSASAIHVPTGVFASFAAGRRSDDLLGTTTAWDAKAGIEKAWTSYGPTTLFLEFGRLELANSTGNGWGAGAVQSIGPLDLFAGFRDVEGTVEVLSGARLKF